MSDNWAKLSILVGAGAVLGTAVYLSRTFDFQYLLNRLPISDKKHGHDHTDGEDDEIRVTVVLEYSETIPKSTSASEVDDLFTDDDFQQLTKELRGVVKAQSKSDWRLCLKLQSVNYVCHIAPNPDTHKLDILPVVYVKDILCNTDTKFSCDDWKKLQLCVKGGLETHYGSKCYISIASEDKTVFPTSSSRSRNNISISSYIMG